jgi:hypothetical protein
MRYLNEQLAPPDLSLSLSLSAAYAGNLTAWLASTLHLLVNPSSTSAHALCSQLRCSGGQVIVSMKLEVDEQWTVAVRIWRWRG